MYDITQVQSVYDSLTTKVKADLDEQFNLGRLKGSDYTEVYTKLMDECLQLAFKAPIEEQQIVSMQNKDTIESTQSDKDLLVKQTQIDEMSQEITSMINKDDREASMLTTDTALKNAEIATQNRQKQGFDDNMKLKMLETQLNAWSMMFSSGLLTTSPSMITSDEASTLYTNLKNGLGIQ